MPGGGAVVPSVTAPDGTVLNTANAALSLQPPSVLVRLHSLHCDIAVSSDTELLLHADAFLSADDIATTYSRDRRQTCRPT